MSSATVAQRFQNFVNHPAGPKTIHFWAPAMKWALVIAGISDLKKHPDQVSTNQNIALAATGFVWARYATQIIPKNWSLFTVNIFVALTSSAQLYRKYQYNQEKAKQETK